MLLLSLVVAHPTTTTATGLPLSPPTLQDYFYQADQRHESANIMVREAYKCSNLQDRLDSLRVAIDFFSERKECKFEYKTTEGTPSAI